MNEKTLMKKEAIVSEIVEKIQKAQSVILIDYRGLTVEEETKLRNEYRKAGVEYKVLKNTMIHRAAEKLELTDLFEHLKGPTAVAFGYDDAVAPAKLAINFIKTAKKTQVKAAVVEGKVIGSDGVKALSEMPSKEVLVVQVLGMLNSPITGLVRTLNGTIAKLAYALNAIAEKKTA